jgi:bla regulator protein BlaR1
VWSIFTRFLLANFALALTLAAILLAKRLCGKRLTPAAAHTVSRFSLLLLVLPFVPYGGTRGAGVLSSLLGQWRGLRDLQFGGNSLSGKEIGANDWMQDYVVSASGSTVQPIVLLLAAIWLVGVLVMLILMMRSFHQAHRLGRSAIPADDAGLLRCFTGCKELVRCKRSVRLGYSAEITTPMAVGCFRPMILLPLTRRKLSEAELSGVLLHELYHIKHQDVTLSAVSCLLRALYWCNPSVWLFLRELRTEAEIHCDSDVLHTIGRERGYAYGCTVLSFAAKRESPPWASAQMGGAGRRMRLRIAAIAGYRENTTRRKMGSVFAALLICLVIVCSLPALSVFGAGRVSLPENTVLEDLSGYFDGLEGGFVLHSGAEDRYIVYNEGESTRRMSPASTGKIFSLLFALDAGVVDARDSMRAWDGTEYEFENWRRDHDLYSAIRDSVNWYYERLDTEVGFPRLRQYYV